jgi:hypothetical protein
MDVDPIHELDSSDVDYGDNDTQTPTYRLKPLTSEQIALFAEYWQMWRRWEDACNLGQVAAGKPAVLAVDRVRHDEIEPLVNEALAIPQNSGIVARGEFRPAADANRERDGRWGGFEVVWTQL